MHDLTTNLAFRKIYEYVPLVAFIFFSSCGSDCQSVKETITGKDDIVTISMFKCDKSTPIFELQLDLDLANNPYDSLSTKKYIHIPKKNISLKKHEDYDYKISARRIDSLNFMITMMIREGNKVQIDATEFKAPELNQKNDNSFQSYSTESSKWIVSFQYKGSIQKTDDKITQVDIMSSGSNSAVRKMFYSNTK